jgi:lipopolysaccharide/colanic/teichoic acid biosynthesis glycosyltransferase
MKVVKHVLDRVVALCLLVALSPICLVVLVLVRIKLGSPAIYHALRVGKDSRVFILHKFRSMTNETDSNGDLLDDERRLTRFGQFLRSSSLDELPSLWNVIRGDLSLVGPRPFSSVYLGMYTPLQNRRHEVLPGITGLAQVSGRNDLSWPEKFGYDLEYVDNWSIVLDLKILIKTVGKVFGRKDISSEGHVTAPPFRGAEEGAEITRPFEHQ